jgi:hypothetical protein
MPEDGARRESAGTPEREGVPDIFLRLLEGETTFRPEKAISLAGSGRLVTAVVGLRGLEFARGFEWRAILRLGVGVSHGDGYLKLMRAKCGSRNISKDT